jgi:omega-amidase
MESLSISLLQTHLAWEDPETNLRVIGAMLDEIPSGTDIVLLPEMFPTGFSINPERCAEKMDGPSMIFLAEKAKEKDSLITGSILIEDDGKYFNRLVCMQPDGTFSFYDKRHLFRLSEEYKVMSSGNERIIIGWKGWKILPLVCYDLRFPAWSRNIFENGHYGYDLLLYVANWPASRTNIWKTLLPARAIENLAYVAGVNRTGNDGQGTANAGESLVAGPDGNLIAISGAHAKAVLNVTLSRESLENFRKKYPFGPDWDRISIQ